MFGVLLIAKEHGGTSHDVVNAIRHKFGTRRVGHAGTLDPLATGLLVVAIGPATRFLQYLPLEPKEYVAEIRFGRATSTYDEEGHTTFEGPVPNPLQEAVDAALPQFTGLIQQLPPMYSAVKKDGQPLYKLARKGIEIEREPRTVHIAEWEIINSSPERMRARIVCSGGTYIRSLAHDLGRALGCGAYLAGLERTGVGRFKLSDARPISEISFDDVVPLAEALAPMPQLTLTREQSVMAQDGRALTIEQRIEGKHVCLLSESGAVLGVARIEENVLHPECVLPKEVIQTA